MESKTEKTIRNLLSDFGISEFENDMRFWRKRISDTVFYFLSFFGFLVYIPSIILAYRDGLYVVILADTIMYAVCLFITFYKKLGHRIRAVIGAVLFYLLGLALLIILGPAGAGGIWLFAGSIVTALLLGNAGALTAFVVNTLTQILFYFLIRGESISWADGESITSGVWLVKSISFIFLNLVIVIINAIFSRGFKVLLSRANETRNASIIGLAKLAEHRDIDTGEHLSRIKKYSVFLAEELSLSPQYRKYITRDYIKDLETSSILHDIGKVGIQDAILLKPGPLTDLEFEQIKQHPVIGGDVISEIEKNIEGRSFYVLGREIALYHHEKWDGSGYPEGLQGQNIPLSARIVALADVYDALTSKRPYKDEISHQETVAIIIEGRGRHFDPDIVDAFLNVLPEFENG